MVMACLRVIGEDSIVAAAAARRPAAPVAVAEGGVDVGRQIEVRSDPVEEPEQLRAFLWSERVADRVFVLGDEVERVVEQRLAAPGDVERPEAPVVGIWSAFDQPSRLELVDDRDDSARGYVQSFGERLLRLPVVHRDGPQHGELARMELERFERTVKAPRDRVAERRQQEADAGGRGVRTAGRQSRYATQPERF